MTWVDNKQSKFERDNMKIGDCVLRSIFNKNGYWINSVKCTVLALRDSKIKLSPPLGRKNAVWVPITHVSLYHPK